MGAAVEGGGGGASDLAGRGGRLAVNLLGRAANGLSCVRGGERASVKVRENGDVLPTGGHGASNNAHAAATAISAARASDGHPERESRRQVRSSICVGSSGSLRRPPAMTS